MKQEIQSGAVEQGFNTAGEAISSGKTVQQIQTQYATAVSVQKPRDLGQVEQRCMQEAVLAGAVCFYGWGAGKDRIEGPSIDCAMIAVRNWGNAVVEMRPVHETPTAYIMEAAFIDLETGFTYTRQFRQSKKWTVYGKMDTYRKDDVRFQIGQSKAQRNVVLKAVPKWLIDKMIEKAKEGVREKLETFIGKQGIEAARKLALDALAKFGVPLERIEQKYDKKYGAWDVELLVTLKGDIRALSDGVESADALFPEEVEPDPEPQKPNGSLSTEDMQPGDPATHQGHELAESRDDLIKQIGALESQKVLPKKPLELRADIIGYADMTHKKVTLATLVLYRDNLANLPDREQKSG